MVEIDIVRDESDEAIVVAVIRSGAGTLKVMAEVSFEDGCLILDGVHLHAPGLAANGIGAGRLRRLMREVVDELGVEAVVVRGARRTSGARPGRRPRPIRIARHAASDCESGDD